MKTFTDQDFITDIVTNNSGISEIKITYAPLNLYVTAVGEQCIIRSKETKLELLEDLKIKIEAEE
tara:strand:+ start:2330 stop:2524 length:195 start_codon:yes stop_codon:yes gene_type:complete